MRYILPLLLLLAANSVYATCYSVAESSHPCRYPKGDSWCQSKGKPPYAYADKCLKRYPAPGSGSGSSVSDSISRSKYVRIVNKSGESLVWVYITKAGDSTWGGDQLGNDIIEPGATGRWNIPWSGCNVDVKAKTSSGSTAQRLGVNACGGFNWTLY